MTEQSMTIVDPDYYTTTADVQRADSETLKRVHAEARRIYWQCGGHKLAHRMQVVQTLVEIELHERDGIEPKVDADDYRVMTWEPIA